MLLIPAIVEMDEGDVERLLSHAEELEKSGLSIRTVRGLGYYLDNR